MTDLAARLAAVQRAYREGLRPLLGARYRVGRSHEGNLWAKTGGQDDWKDDFPIGSVRTGELAAGICDDHNALLDLAWLAKAGFDVTVSFRVPVWRVEIPGTSYGALVMCGQGETAGEALAAARKWAEGKNRHG